MEWIPVERDVNVSSILRKQYNIMSTQTTRLNSYIIRDYTVSEKKIQERIKLK